MNSCERVQKSIDFIEDHLKDSIDIHEVIHQSNFSITHFYRIFRALVGESLKDYIRKRRLNNAAIELCTSNKRLIDIVFEYGFNSQEVFTRAFYRTYGITPGRYRSLDDKMMLYEKVNVYQKMLAHWKEKFPLEPQIILNNQFNVVGMKQTVKPGDPTIQNLWNEFTARKEEVKCTTTTEYLLGLCEYMPNITDDSEFTYIASIEVDHFNNVPIQMITKTIPPSKYAVFTHVGPMDGLKDTYNFIHGAWLSSTTYELAELDTIECYYSDKFDIYIPLK